MALTPETRSGSGGNPSPSRQRRAVLEGEQCRAWKSPDWPAAKSLETRQRRFWAKEGQAARGGSPAFIPPFQSRGLSARVRLSRPPGAGSRTLFRLRRSNRTGQPVNGAS